MIRLRKKYNPHTGHFWYYSISKDDYTSNELKCDRQALEQLKRDIDEMLRYDK